MNKKRKLMMFLNLFLIDSRAHNELKESEKNDKNHNNLLIEKENSINIHKNLIKEKSIGNPLSRDGDWSNLTFNKIEFTKDKNVNRNIESKKIQPENFLADNNVEKVFLDSLKNWQKKNLKNLTESTYQEIVKEIKKKLK